MKKALIFLIIPFLGFSQNEFRKMNWGESSSDLFEKYPNISFEKEILQDMTVFAYEGTVGGLETSILYGFVDDKLFTGMYIFSLESNKSTKEKLSDFYYVSQSLNEKYSMERVDEWLVTTWKDDLNNLHHAVAMGDVQVVEMGNTDKTVIRHVLGEEDNTIQHKLFYFSIEMISSIEKKMNDDF